MKLVGYSKHPMFPSSHYFLCHHLQKIKNKITNRFLLSFKEMEPVIVYMRDQICGETRLKSTSLKSLGLISGRGLLRLNQRQKTQDSTPTSVAAASSDAAMDVDAASVTATTSTVAAAAAPDDPLAGMKLSDEQMKMIESISEMSVIRMSRVSWMSGMSWMEIRR